MDLLFAFSMMWTVSLILLSAMNVNGQDCPMLQISDLGNTTAPSTAGLLADTIAAQTGVVDPFIRIIEVNVVCLGQGSVRDTYRTISLVVEYFSETSRNVSTVQVDYQCVSSGGWGFAGPGALNANPTATLTTVLRRDCVLCIDPTAPVDTPSLATPDEHCVGKYSSNTIIMPMVVIILST